MSQVKRVLAMLYWLPAAVLLTDLYTVKQVSGRSMQPTLNPDSSLLWRDVGLFDRVSIYTQRYNRGDIVALKSPYDAKRELVKRIIAVEGDIVRTLAPNPEAEVRVPKNHIWVEGDAFHSQDSNTFGPVPLGLVDSRLVFLVWPIWRLGFPGLLRPNTHPRVSPTPTQ
ncbi:signal peptidase [Mycena pura]|uniref:Mitochondrial inner membrane protease subunit n=1 Tax=Mycena pura TaxID=153505 RepID=A0AAD7E4V3_9AGAR|nr:signal peptidase [Mycena pura]